MGVGYGFLPVVWCLLLIPIAALSAFVTLIMAALRSLLLRLIGDATREKGSVGFGLQAFLVVYTALFGAVPEAPDPAAREKATNDFAWQAFLVVFIALCALVYTLPW